MGRAKLRIRRLETALARQVTYSKRKVGLTKKANELGILCDIDLALVIFSPTGKPTLCLGPDGDLSRVVERFASMSMQERMKRKLEVMETLRKTFQKQDHDVDVGQLMGDGRARIEELNDQRRVLEAKIQETYMKLSFWAKPEQVDDLTQITTMEDSLVESLDRLEKRKLHLEERRAQRQQNPLQGKRYCWLPENHMAHATLCNNRAPAAPKRAFGYHGSSSGWAENAIVPYEYQQPVTGFDNPTVGMDINLNGPSCSLTQEDAPSGDYYGPQAPLPALPWYHT